MLDARGVVPVTGNVMVFPHGGTQGSLVHEGSAVLKVSTVVSVSEVPHGGPRTCSHAFMLYNVMFHSLNSSAMQQPTCHSGSLVHEGSAESR